MAATTYYAAFPGQAPQVMIFDRALMTDEIARLVADSYSLFKEKVLVKQAGLLEDFDHSMALYWGRQLMESFETKEGKKMETGTTQPRYNDERMSVIAHMSSTLWDVAEFNFDIGENDRTFTIRMVRTEEGIRKRCLEQEVAQTLEDNAILRKRVDALTNRLNKIKVDVED